MSTTLPIVSANLPCIVKLEDAETALQDFQQFNLDHIGFIIIGNIPPDKTHQHRMLRVVNRLCASPTSDDRLKVLWIENGEMLDAIKPEITRAIQEAFPGKQVQNIQAYTTPFGAQLPEEVIAKGPSFSMSNIKKAMNLATIASPTPPTV